MSDERILKTLSRAIEMGAEESMLRVGDIQWLMTERDVCREELAAETSRRMRAEVDLLLARKQRDEAQREVCEMVADACKGLPHIPPGPEHVARFRGWDCYPEGEG